MPHARMFKLLSMMMLLGALLLLSARDAHAQAESCDALLEIFEQVVDPECREINNNWACYGNVDVESVPTDIRFNRPRDRQPIEVFESITTNGPTGMVLLYMHMDQTQDPVKVALYGDATLEESEGQLSVLRVEDNRFVCADTPPGMVVRTEDGERGLITLNGVEIELGSVAFLTMQTETLLTVTNWDGDVQINVPELDVAQPIEAGQQLRIHYAEDTPVLVDPPRPAPEMDSALLQWLTSEEGLGQVWDPNLDPALSCNASLTYGAIWTDRISVPGQECLYTFQGTAGDQVTVQVDALMIR